MYDIFKIKYFSELKLDPISSKRKSIVFPLFKVNKLLVLYGSELQLSTLKSVRMTFDKYGVSVMELNQTKLVQWETSRA